MLDATRVLGCSCCSLLSYLLARQVTANLGRENMTLPEDAESKAWNWTDDSQFVDNCAVIAI